jgi:hypothetical protein
MNVYILVESDYAVDRIVGVYSTLESAEQARDEADSNSARRYSYFIDGYKVQDR